MNKTAIKAYAVWARSALIESVTQRAFEYDIKENSTPNPYIESINGRLLTDNEKDWRKKLIDEINQKSFSQVMEEAAYTWFNRFISLRYMEVNGFIPSRVRVFTNEHGEFKPDILKEAMTVEIDGLDRAKVIEYIEKQNNEELFKYLIITQCNALNIGLPYMFEKISNWTELLFPANLLRADSIIGRMVTDIPEEDWKDAIQIIGWMYQFYNIEPKSKVFSKTGGEKITKEEIPAATQLFTPEWIVKYMVENSLGKLWIEGHPDDSLKENWKYYLDEAEQEPEVEAELQKIRTEYANIKPEDIKIIDPCMGSGHILVYAFDVLLQIYVANGYSERDAAKSILENNLYGLDIDDRAGQLAYFAIMMKARKYNRRALLGGASGILPNVYAIKESNYISTLAIDDFCNGDLKVKAEMEKLIAQMRDAKEYGSILNINNIDFELLLSRCDAVSDEIHFQQNEINEDIIPLIKIAYIMAQKYDVTVTNPPYMAVSSANSKLSSYVVKNYPDSKTDMFAVFIERCGQMLKKNGFQAMITMHSWMFLSSYEKLRNKLLLKDTISMAHLGARAFEEIGGEVVQTTGFVLSNKKTSEYKSIYCRLVESNTQKGKEDDFLSKKNRYIVSDSHFLSVPGNPIAYWAAPGIIKVFQEGTPLSSLVVARNGMKTGDNNRFLRLWWEVSNKKTNLNAISATDAIESKKKWFPYNKGGEARKWYGNNDYVVNWEYGGTEIFGHAKADKRNVQDYPESMKFTPSGTWSLITTGSPSFRFKEFNLSDIAGMSFYNGGEKTLLYLGFCNTPIAGEMLQLIAPTINYQAGDIGRLPILMDDKSEDDIRNLVTKNIDAAKEDWDSFETSWDFKKHPLVPYAHTTDKIELAYENWEKKSLERFIKLKENEEELNRIFIDIYGLQDELTPEVEEKDVTVRKADLQREIKSLISYAVGCIFGRYSLDVEGLAFAGGEWDSSKYKTIIPDEDNILPICDDDYFEDDLTGKVINFIEVVYGKETLEENLRFIADVLGGKGSSSREIIRNYLLTGFYADHLKIYQKRPIYWQFSSGKKNGFKALIYMHRYKPDLLARMRTDYVHEQQERYRTQIALNEEDTKTASASDRVKINKKIAKLKDQSLEIQKFEEKIHHLADQMIDIDLDDGVKVNYEKFSEVLDKIK